ncbi:cingulin isoform X2 [Monodelphis domestica]|uniref:cingulin isoform X2 n=1 Tax=Monodelphis domestica TaxID=13616 RepID=UPI0024E272D1|nr:cingulin isoform X2 [Monodelphis domestica]XP_056675384.1 cingulin isoform X2 [Monodelphis domestica]
MYMERATAIAEPRAPVDHGVQIRFITESTDSTQSASLRRVGRRPAKDSRASSYGVAVRVQGIAGQPFVVLNSGEKGTDSFGVQIKGNGSRGAPDSLSSDSELPENPYGSPRRFVGSYSQGSTSDEELGTGQKDKLQRSHSHASLLNSAPVGPRVLTGSLLELTPSIGSSGNAIDTAPLSSVDSLICKFDRQGAQTRGRSGCRGRILSPDRRKRSQSLDSRVPRNMAEEREREQEHERDFSNASSPNSKQICTISGLNQGQAPSNAVSKSRQTQEWVFQSFEEPRGRTQDPGLMQFKSTPDLLRDQQEATTPGSADHAKTTIYNILREGSLESEASVKRKVSLVLEQMQALMGSPSSVSQAMAVHRGLIQKIEELQQKLDEEMKKRQKLELTHEPSRLVLERQLEEKVEECMRLQEKLEKKKAEMQRSTQEFQDMKLLLDQGERLRHGLEDQLKEMQDRLRQGQNPDAAKETLLKDLLETRELLEEVLEGKQRQEEQLRQRERELTALKGVLKEEVSSRDQEVERVRQQCQQDMEQLRQSVKDASQDQATLEAERQKVSTLIRGLQRELQESAEETGHWQGMFQKNKEELRGTKQELLQLRLEKEDLEEELREQIGVLQKDLEQARTSAEDNRQAESLKKELKRAQEELQDLREQQSQEAAGKNRERELEKELEALKEEAKRGKGAEQQQLQLHKSLQQLRQDYEETAKAKAMAEAEVTMMGQRRAAVEATLRETQEENDEFRRRILGLEQQLKEARSLAEGGEAVEARLRDKVQRLEAERQRLEKALNASQEEEESLAGAKRMLEGQLEEAQRNLIRFGQEQKILNRALEEEGKQREVLRRNKAELEDQKRLLDKTVEKLNKEMEKIGEESQRALGELQAQLEEYKEKARRDVAGAQRQAKEWASEAEKAAGGLGQLQEEAQRLRQALQALQAERDTALLDKDLLAQKLQGLEKETESKKRSQDDKIRQLKNLEEKVSRLEAELDEERNTVELLTDRVNRARDQIDQLRAELLQERSSRQDLECDKISLERQNKDLKSRLASLEGFQKPSASLSQLEFQNQELQDRLQTEEREKTLLQTTNRKLERRVKELSIQIDDERQHVNDQKDQLSLRVKALKRQVDEAEEEIERLDSLRKKAQRELEEQHEVNEQLQARIKTLEKDSRRKATRSAAEASLKHDGLSSDEEFDSIYDPSSIASLLTESNLQTSSC